MNNYFHSTSSRRILVTGGRGQLASAIKHHPQNKHLPLHTPGRDEMDISDIASIARAFEQYQPDIVVNAAAYTAVDKAEQEQEAVLRVNHLGAMNLAVACHKQNIPLIQISTDYVFNGASGEPYQENHPADPVNFYGKSKWLGEQAVREQCENHVILRVSGVFSEFGQNFLKTILQLAKNRDELRVVMDQVTCPTDAQDIAGVIFQIAKNIKQTGTYHYCSNPPVSWHEFASAIIAEARNTIPLRAHVIHAITTQEFPTAAHRPSYAVLNCGKINRDYGITQPSWHGAIQRVVSVLAKEPS